VHGHAIWPYYGRACVFRGPSRGLSLDDDGGHVPLHDILHDHNDVYVISYVFPLDGGDLNGTLSDGMIFESDVYVFVCGELLVYGDDDLHVCVFSLVSGDERGNVYVYQYDESDADVSPCAVLRFLCGVHEP